MPEVTRLDFVDVSQCRYDADGFLRDSPVLTRAGIFEYKDRSGNTVREFRPPEEVFDPSSLATLKGVPITVDHGVELFKADHPDLEPVGSVLSEGRKDSSNDLHMVGDIVIFHPSKGGDRRELSLGYRCVPVKEPGTWNGKPYDVKQTKIRYNHLAWVRRGRAGVAKLRLDSEDTLVNGLFEEDSNVADPVKLTNVRLDGLDYQAAPEVARALNRFESDMAGLQRRLDAAEAERDTLKAKVTDLEGKQEQVRKDAADQVRHRIELETEAKKHSVEFKDEHSDRMIREAVVKKLRGEGFRMDGKSDDYVMFAYDSAIADAAGKDKSVADARSAMNPNPGVFNTRQDAASVTDKPKGAAGFRKHMLKSIGR